MDYYWHHTTIGRLVSILTHGLLSVSTAKKLGIKRYRRNLKSTWNNNYVSLMAGDSKARIASPGLAVLVDPNSVSVVEPNGVKQEVDVNNPLENEKLVKDMISPSAFRGIIIGDFGWSFRLVKEVKPHPLSLKRVLKEVNKVPTAKNLPVYFKGEKIWPKEN